MGIGFGKAAALVVVAQLALGCNSATEAPRTTAGVAPPSTVIDAASGLGVVIGPPPWDAPFDDVLARAQAAHLPALTAEAFSQHIHIHLDVFYSGTAVRVPANIGIDPVNQRITPLHTHDDSGVVHIESADLSTFTLGQVLTEWGLRVGQGCIAGICPPTPISVVVNGKAVPGDPAAVVLHAHDEIAVVLGTAPGTVPSSFVFPQGY